MSSRSDTIVGALAGGLALAVFGVLGWAAMTVVDSVRESELQIKAILVRLERQDAILERLDTSGDSRRPGGSSHR